MLAVDGEHLAFFANARAHHAGDAAQGAHLPGEMARRVHYDRFFAGKAWTHDLDAPRKDDEHQPVALARLGQHLALARAHLFSVRLETRDLRRGEPRKGLLPAGFDGIGRRGFPALGLPAHSSSMPSSSTKH